LRKGLKNYVTQEKQGQDENYVIRMVFKRLMYYGFALRGTGCIYAKRTDLLRYSESNYGMPKHCILGR